jgi:ABC-type branched-subunit amino acid transport system substrate-binding protein
MPVVPAAGRDLILTARQRLDGSRSAPGPQVVCPGRSNAEGAKKYGFQVVLDEGSSASTPDLSSLVTKLKRGRPDVIFHTGYNPDITLFLRQSRELGLKFSTLVGQGAGYGVYSKLKETVAATPTISTTATRSRCGRPTRKP